MPKLLVIDDDLELAKALKEFFESTGFLVEHAATGEDGLQLLGYSEFDTVLLDWMLPGMTGVEVCRKYRSTGGKSHIIFLTGQGEVEEIETGLDAGADDYLVKPFKIRELSARIRSVQRRPASLLSNELKLEDLVLDPVKHIVKVNDQEHQLAPKESALLEFLLRNPNRPCHADTLVNAVWPSDGTGSVESVRTWMKTLRKKLAAAGKQDLIKTVPGVGYLIELQTTR